MTFEANLVPRTPGRGCFKATTYCTSWFTSVQYLAQVDPKTRNSCETLLVCLLLNQPLLLIILRDLLPVDLIALGAKFIKMPWDQVWLRNVEM